MLLEVMRASFGATTERETPSSSSYESALTKSPPSLASSYPTSLPPLFVVPPLFSRASITKSSNEAEGRRVFVQNTSPVQSHRGELTSEISSESHSSGTSSNTERKGKTTTTMGFKRISSTRLGSLRLSIEGISPPPFFPTSPPPPTVAVLPTNPTPAQPFSTPSSSSPIRSRSSSLSIPNSSSTLPYGRLSRKGSYGGDPALGRILASRRLGNRWDDEDGGVVVGVVGGERGGAGVGLGFSEYPSGRNESAPELPLKNLTSSSLPETSNFPRRHATLPPSLGGRRLTSTNLALHRHSFHAKTPFDHPSSSHLPLSFVPPSSDSTKPCDPTTPATGNNRGVGIIGGEITRPIFLRTASGTNLIPRSRRVVLISGERFDAPLPAPPSFPDVVVGGRRGGRGGEGGGGEGGVEVESKKKAEPKYVLRPTKDHSTQTTPTPTPAVPLSKKSSTSSSSSSSTAAAARIWKKLPGTSGAAPYHFLAPVAITTTTTSAAADAFTFDRAREYIDGNEGVGGEEDLSSSLAEPLEMTYGLHSPGSIYSFVPPPRRSIEVEGRTSLEGRSSFELIGGRGRSNGAGGGSGGDGGSGGGGGGGYYEALIDSIVEGKSRPLSAVEWMGTIVAPPSSIALPLSSSPAVSTAAGNENEEEEDEDDEEEEREPIQPFVSSPLSFPTSLPSSSPPPSPADQSTDSSIRHLNSLDRSPSPSSSAASSSSPHSATPFSSPHFLHSNEPPHPIEIDERGKQEEESTRNWRYEALIPSPTFTYAFIPPISPTFSDTLSLGTTGHYSSFVLPPTPSKDFLPYARAPTTKREGATTTKREVFGGNRRISEIGSTTKDRVEKGRSFFLDKDLVVIDKDWIGGGRRNTFVAAGSLDGFV